MATKGTAIKDALIKYEEKYQEKATDAKHIRLMSCIPPLEKMDASLSTLTNCTKLSLSTNSIEKIANLNGLKNLRILSLGRNSIKSLTGLEAVGETLQELWISYNFIEKLKGINVLKKLRVLYISWNLVKDKSEFQKLTELSFLEELLFIGNPLVESMDSNPAEGPFKAYAEKVLTKLKKLDGIPVIREEESEQQQQQRGE